MASSDDCARWTSSSRVEVEDSTADARELEVEDEICRFLEGSAAVAVGEGVTGVSLGILPLGRGILLGTSVAASAFASVSGAPFSVAASRAKALRNATYLRTAGAMWVMLSEPYRQGLKREYRM